MAWVALLPILPPRPEGQKSGNGSSHLSIHAGNVGYAPLVKPDSGDEVDEMNSVAAHAPGRKTAMPMAEAL